MVLEVAAAAVDSATAVAVVADAIKVASVTQAAAVVAAAVADVAVALEADVALRKSLAVTAEVADTSASGLVADRLLAEALLAVAMQLQFSSRADVTLADAAVLEATSASPSDTTTELPACTVLSKVAQLVLAAAVAKTNPIRLNRNRAVETQASSD